MTDTIDAATEQKGVPARMEPAPGQALASKIASEDLAAVLLARAGH